MLENYTPKNTSPEKAASKIATSKNTSPEKAASKIATSKNTSPEKAAFKIATPKNTSPQNGTSKNVSPKIDTLEALVRALCADYPRRQEEIEKSELSPRVLMEYKYFNVLIFRAVAEVVGELEAMLYIEDIGERRGYSKRLDLFISENTYDKRKRQCKINIARALKLADW